MRLLLPVFSAEGPAASILCNAQYAWEPCTFVTYQIARPRIYARHNARTKTYGIEKEIIMGIARSFAEWRRYRATCNELSRLTSRELNDLGINRGDIPFVARKASRS
jgi:uncharacterized protein YjiS (DUF1127 family)